MEASKFGFDLEPPAFKFDPTDADLVVHYLLPRALGIPNPHAHAISEDDPRSAPPWEILEKHGHHAAEDQVVHAFFFGPATDPTKNGGRRSRTVQGGGVWQGQKGGDETITLLSPGGGSELEITYRRYNLTFKLLEKCTGYVMHEYEIVSPPLPDTVLTRIKAKKNARPPVEQAVLQLPDPEQTGPSYEYDAAAGVQGFSAAQDGALYDSNGYYYAPPRYDLPVGVYENNYCNTSAMVNNGETFTGAQANGFYGGGIVEYSNYYGEHQQQQDTSNQYQAEDGALMCTGGQQPTIALCGNGDKGSVTQSTVSLCDGVKAERDDITFYNNCDPSNCVRDCAGEYNNNYGECQQWRYQQDPSNQYQAGDHAAVMCAQEFIAQQQTACGNSEEYHKCDDITFYNMLMFGTGEDNNFKCDQNDAAAGTPSTTC